jgi:hypothetical protein
MSTDRDGAEAGPSSRAFSTRSHRRRDWPSDKTSTTANTRPLFSAPATPPAQDVASAIRLSAARLPSRTTTGTSRSTDSEPGGGSYTPPAGAAARAAGPAHTAPPPAGARAGPAGSYPSVFAHSPRCQPRPWPGKRPADTHMMITHRVRRPCRQSANTRLLHGSRDQVASRRRHARSGILCRLAGPARAVGLVAQARRTQVCATSSGTLGPSAHGARPSRWAQR